MAALWLGSGVFLLAVAAPAAFRASDSPTNAANVVGAMLAVWHYIAVALPLILLAIEWRRARAWMIAILFGGILFAATQIAVDLRIRAIRELSAPIPISSLPRTDPLRRRFGALHGLSSLLLLAEVVVAGAAVASDTET